MPVMIIGHHILYGKEMELDQPVVAITKHNSEGSCNFLKEMIICIFLDRYMLLVKKNICK